MIQRRISRSSTNALGRRIRHDGLGEADRERLELLLADAFDGLTVVSNTLRRELPDVRFTPRLKTVGTIIDKIGREPTMALSRMRDIAGIRIVEEMNRVEQDVLVRSIEQAFGITTKPIDRRVDPRHGYRAVHIEVDVDGCFVEIQVRTRLQDQWAQIVERLADSWGRQIRYGGSPSGPEDRGVLWGIIQRLSVLVDGIEVDEAEAALEAPEDDERRIIAATRRRDLTGLLSEIEEIAIKGLIQE